MTRLRIGEIVPPADIPARSGTREATVAGTNANGAPGYLGTQGSPLDPDGRVLDAVFSGGPIGRVFAEGAIEMVACFGSKA